MPPVLAFRIGHRTVCPDCPLFPPMLPEVLRFWPQWYIMYQAWQKQLRVSIGGVLCHGA